MTGRNIQGQESVMIKKAFLLMASWQNRIKQVMREKKITQEKLAEMVGVSQGALSHWFSGRRQIDLSSLLKIADALSIPHSELLSEDVGLQTKFQDVSNVANTPWDIKKHGMAPLISWINAGEFREVDSIDITQMHVEEWLPMPAGAGPNTYCLMVEGWSMFNPNGERSYPPGVIIYVDPDKPAEKGKRVIARVGSECTFKELTEDAGKMFLRPLNSQYQMIEVTKDVTFCGVVIGSFVKE